MLKIILVNLLKTIKLNNLNTINMKLIFKIKFHFINHSFISAKDLSNLNPINVYIANRSPSFPTLPSLFILPQNSSAFVSSNGNFNYLQASYMNFQNSLLSRLQLWSASNSSIVSPHHLHIASRSLSIATSSPKPSLSAKQSYFDKSFDYAIYFSCVLIRFTI